MNTDQLAALSESDLIDAVCHCGVRNGMTHPDISGLVDELALRRGISKAEQKLKPKRVIHTTGPKVATTVTVPTIDGDAPVPVNFGEGA